MAVIAPPPPAVSWGRRLRGLCPPRGLSPSSGGGLPRCVRVGSALVGIPSLVCVWVPGRCPGRLWKGIFGLSVAARQRATCN